MAQGSQQLDLQILHDLKHRFPEIPEGVVSQCMLQNNNNLEACCRALALESSKYLYGEYHSPEDTRMNRNHMLHINLGIHSATRYQAGDGAQTNGGRTLVHSSSDGHIDPQRGGAKQQMVCMLQEPHSAPATVAPSPVYNPFFMNEQSCTANTPPPTSLPPGMSASAMQGLSPTYTPIPRYTMNPITVTLSQNIPATPRALHLPSQIQNCPYATPGNAVFIRSASSQSPSGRQTPQSSPWHSPTAQCHMQPYNQQPHAIPVYQTQPSPYQPTQYSSKQPQMPQSAFHSPPPSQFPSPYSSPQHQIQPSQPCHQTSHVPLKPCYSGPRVRVTQPGNSAYTFKIKVSPGRPVQRQVESPTVETESILNLVEQGEHPGAPEPIQPISALPGTIGDRGSNKYRRKFSSGSDDYAYTQALLLHQQARMERLVKELHLENQILEKLKTDVNSMEYDLMQRRFHRVNTTSLIPVPEDMTRLRSHNRQLQINIDCTLKEIDLLKSRGKFDPKAMNNFYDHIQPGPVVPPKPSKKEPRTSSKPRRQPRDEDFEGAHWNCESCTFLNHPALIRCEQCEMPRYT
ncbi:UNVERIFIED_CONTAM: hypothetical protein FKN15_078177 [Acipenser sinensis]